MKKIAVCLTLVAVIASALTGCGNTENVPIDATTDINAYKTDVPVSEVTTTTEATHSTTVTPIAPYVPTDDPLVPDIAPNVSDDIQLSRYFVDYGVPDTEWIERGKGDILTSLWDDQCQYLHDGIREYKFEGSDYYYNGCGYGDKNDCIGVEIVDKDGNYVDPDDYPDANTVSDEDRREFFLKAISCYKTDMVIFTGGITVGTPRYLVVDYLGEGTPSATPDETTVFYKNSTTTLIITYKEGCSSYLDENGEVDKRDDGFHVSRVILIKN